MTEIFERLAFGLVALFCALMMRRLVLGINVEVGKEGVDAKVKALSMYRGVMRPYPHPRSAEYITGLAAMRGGQWGQEYAEAFEVVLRAY